MKQKFGIFKAIGEQVRFNKLGGLGLIQLSTPLFNTPEEAIEYIEYSSLINPQTSNFMIMPVIEYFKNSEA